MRSYRFDGLVQGRLLHLQLALFILVKVIPTLRKTQAKDCCIGNMHQFLVEWEERERSLFDLVNNTVQLIHILFCF